jgi:hypothetical protein
VSAWFARVGLPLSDGERAAIGELLRGVVPDAPVVVTALASWQEAAVFVRAAAHDSAWWDDEEEERERLWARAAEDRSETGLFELVTAATRGLDVELRDAALAAMAVAGTADRDIADEAVAMGLLTAHQRALAEIAGAGTGHRFSRKYALFEEGRWPVGYHSARFVIF